MTTPLRVVLTGGPAGGKTTAIGLLAKHYRNIGHLALADRAIIDSWPGFGGGG